MSTDETKPLEVTNDADANSDIEPAPEDRDSGAMRALLQRATRSSEAEAKIPDLLPAVQRKIRKRSRGKFFGDGFSTTTMRVNYALIAIVMLSVIALAYVALGPTGISH